MRTLTGIQVRPRHASEFDRRIRCLKPALVRDILILVDAMPASRDSLNRYLFSAFDLDKADRSLVMSYEDYLAIYSDQISNFFFSSTEDEVEYSRRKSVLEGIFGTRAKTFIRKKIASRSNPRVSTEPELVLAVPEHTIIEVAAQEPETEYQPVDEGQLWSYVLEQKDADLIVKEIKRIYGDVVNDPTDILAECSKLGIPKLTAKIRRSYIFK
jgi:hypothetical protein